MSKPFKIVKILDEFTVVMNAGSDLGIYEGQKFLIYELSDEEIIDPDTKKSLGFLEIVKGTGIVTHVQESMSTLKSATYHSTSKKIKHLSPFSNPLFNSSVEEIESDKTQVPFDDPEIGDLLKRVN